MKTADILSMESQTKDQEKMFITPISNKRPVSKIHKELSELNNHKISNQLKIGQNTWVDPHQRRHREQISTSGDVPGPRPQGAASYKETPLHACQDSWTPALTIEGVEQWDLSLIATGNTRQSSHFGEEFGSFYKTVSPHNPTIMLLGIYLKEVKNYAYTKSKHECL